MPRPQAALETRIAVAQVDALFSFVAVGVSGAAVASGILAVILSHLGLADGRTAATWVAYIVICAVGHVLLRHAYRRARPVGEDWRLWAFLFTAISLAEGIGWGWSPVGLATGDRFDVDLVVIIVTVGVGAGAVPCFSPYLPAFFALFLPSTIPYAISSFVAADPVRNATVLLMLVFMATMSGLGVAANKSFKQLVSLRFRTEELAADLQMQKEIAEQANLAKSTFLAAASHDLRQPVHALGLFVGALRGVAMPREGQRMLEQIEISIDAMDGLFTALLDISRLDAGTVEVHRSPFAIGPLIERICQEYAVDALAKGISVTWTRSAAMVESDPVLIERILRNLVSNAVRYTDRGRVLVGCRRRSGKVSIQVWDTGPGIPPDQRERVFLEYYQLGNPERDRTKGLGLGLAIVRRLTDLLQCRLTLRSTPGRGSCFGIDVPLARDDPRSVALTREPLSNAFAPGLIVVVDDELQIRDAMASLLTDWGHAIVVSSTGDEAIGRLSASPTRPDLIISDYRLRDDENGIEVIERLRSEYNATIPAILITGDTAPDRLVEARKSGLLLLHKPVSNSKLRAAIVNLMRAPETDEAAE